MALLEISHTRTHVHFRTHVHSVARPTIAIAKIRDYSQSRKVLDSKIKQSTKLLIVHLLTDICEYFTQIEINCVLYPVLLSSDLGKLKTGLFM